MSLDFDNIIVKVDNKVVELKTSEVPIMVLPVNWDDIPDKPETFPPSEHDHDERYYTKEETYTKDELDASLADKADVITASASGSVASFSDGAPAPVVDLVASIEPVQDLHGYDYPWPAGGGKNLFNKDATETTKGYVNDYYLTYTDALVSNNQWEISEYISLLPTTAYVLSVPIGNVPAICFYDSNKDFISGVSYSNRSTISFTTSGDTSFCRLSFKTSDAPSFQLEKGTTASPVEPYSNICPISGWTSCNVTRTGKNLLPNDRSYPFTDKGVTVSKNADGSITLSGAKNESSSILADVHVFEKNIQMFHGKYLKEQINNTVGIVVTYYDANGQWVNAQNGMNIQLNVPSGATKMSIRLRISTNDDVTGTVLHPMICENKSDTYEPYQGTTYPISFGEAGTVYGGILKVKTEILTVTKACHVFTGTETFINVSNRLAWQLPVDDAPPISTYTYNAISSLYPARTSSQTYQNRASANYLGVSADSQSSRYVFIIDTEHFINGVNTIDDYKGYLATMYQNGTPLTVVWDLKIPRIYQLTPTEVLTLLGQNNVWADTGDVNVTYRADTKLYIDQKITESQRATRSLIAGIESAMTATQNYSAGDLLIVGDTLYKATANIASGGAITVGTNVVATTVAEQLILLANA